MKKILVVGDSCIDKYIYGNCSRLCPEGPVPVFNPIETKENFGMAFNTYANLLVFNKKTHILTNNNVHQIKKTRYVDEKTNHLFLRVDENDFCDSIKEDQLNFIKKENYDAIVISDYDKGFLTKEIIIDICKMAPYSFVDSKKKLDGIEKVATFIKINKEEYKNNFNLVDTFPEKFIITLGGDGVKYKEKIYKPLKTFQTFDVSGAGDVFLASFVYKILKIDTYNLPYNIYSILNIEEAINFAQSCCSMVIQKRGTCIYEENMH